MSFCIRTTVLAGAAVLLASLASAAGTVEQECQAAKNKAAGKYAACRQSAEAKLAASGDATQYATALGPCATKFAHAWQKASDRAARAGAACLDDPLTIGDFASVIVQHTNEVTAALGGGGLATCSGVVLATGQVTSYGPGSDASVARSAARSYADNGDGTITDTATGLMWEKKSDDDSIHDKDGTYSWGMTSSPYAMNGTMVTTFLAALNGGTGFAGYTDWRVPNENELQTLANYENVAPAVSPAFDSGCVAGCTVTTCSCTRSGPYWSSTTAMYESEPSLAWGVGFRDGAAFGNVKSNEYGVRAVRGGS